MTLDSPGQRQNAPGKMYVPFDEWIYRNIIDLCLDFCYNYQDLYTDYHDEAIARCENIFEALCDFSADCDELPMDMKDPPLDEWSEMDRMPNGVINQRRALNYVMRLMNELKRQQMEKGRDPNQLIKKYGLDKKPKTAKKTPESYRSLFQGEAKSGI